ncbi:PQQ-binding-like beta-propeller repeat protein [Oscillatoria sp. FACHB-1407]|uniref:WD40 domain-containing protein n=1 Tax=Oscillatoria sp. FACHB-1407 TaxID=2692847 RepID=UPI001683DE0A|nr:PQQ-binding-like beta-propeller repeat protein [Oscillatoria sp. FACHB-1407]MBD2459772.1 PQQ-binding-like beta-propeller repeat protein [Oscillatoria sp. FACHB-1407]
MEFDQVLEITHQAVRRKLDRDLNPVETAILQGAWFGQTYEEIADSTNYSVTYLSRTAGPQLWQLLAEVLAVDISKKNVRTVFQRWISQATVTPEPASEPISSVQNETPIAIAPPAPQPVTAQLSIPLTDWGEAPEVSQFYGRTQELETLTQWISQDRCRLIALLGLGGMGKSSLAAKVAQQLASCSSTPSPLYPSTPSPLHPFTHIIWRSLRNAPPLETLLADLVPFLSNQQDTQPKPERLLHWLRTHRCLLVLDNLESIMQSGDRAGYYQPGYESYGDLFRVLGEAAHQSCLILTSREKPAEISVFEGEHLAVRSLLLQGSWDASLALIEAKGLIGTEAEKRQLCEFYSCSPLALKIVASSIQSLFHGHIAAFLQEEAWVFNGLRRLLDQQFERLPPLEQSIMYWLAINREWVAIADLQQDIVPPVSRVNLLEALESLTWRCLIETAPGMGSEKNASRYTQQPVVMEYVTRRFIERITDELLTQQLALLNRHALLKTTVQNYIRESQARLIIKPITDQLRQHYHSVVAQKRLISDLLTTLRHSKNPLLGYGAGNLLNLCYDLQLDITGYDFSELFISQAYLQEMELRDVNLTHSQLSKTVFAQPFGTILCVAFSPNQQLLATGNDNGEISLWRVSDGQQIVTWAGHTNWIWSLAFSPDGTRLVSGGDEVLIRVWDVATGNCLCTLEGHTGWGVRLLAFSPDGQTIVSAGDDRTIRQWDAQTGQLLQVLMSDRQLIYPTSSRATHQMTQQWNWQHSVTISPNLDRLVSSTPEHTILLWTWRSDQPVRTFEGHTDTIFATAFSPEGQHLISASADQTLKVWDVSTGDCIRTIEGLLSPVYFVKVAPDGQTILTNHEDQTLWLWEISTGHCLKVFQGHRHRIWSVAFSPDGNTIASGSSDQTLRLWDVSTGQTLRTLQGYTSQIYTVAIAPTQPALQSHESPKTDLNSLVIASGGVDKMVRLWDIQKGQPSKTLQGHTGWIWAIAFSPDGKFLASSAGDKTVRLWDVQTGQCLNVFNHQDWVWTVAFGSSAKTLVSGSSDCSIRLWDTTSGKTIWQVTLPGNLIRAIAFSPDGQLIAAGTANGTIVLLDADTGITLQTLEGHADLVRTVAFSPMNHAHSESRLLLASAGEDGLIKLWNPETGTLLTSLVGHVGSIRSIAFSPDGQTLASGGIDCIARCWDINTGELLHVLKGHQHWLMSIAFSLDGQILVSGSDDETIRIWDVKTQNCLKILRSDRPYEGMKITGLTGLTDAQKTSLKALGAIEDVD